MDGVGNVEIAGPFECNSSIQVETSQRRAPTVPKFKANDAELKNVKSKDLCLSYFNGLVKSVTAIKESHHTFGKLNRSVSGPEAHSITLDDDGSTGEPGLEDYFNMFSKFPYEASKPLPLLQPRKATPEVALRGCDPTQELLKKKLDAVHKLRDSKWKIEKNKEPYIRASNEITKMISKEDVCDRKYVRISKVIAPVVRAVEADPNPTFVANYNWFLTGGALTSTRVGQKTVLLFPGGINSSNLIAAPIKKHSSSLTGYKIKEDRIFECHSRSHDDDDQIFEISEATSATDALVSIRRKTMCMVFKCSVEDELNLKRIYFNFSHNQNAYTSVQLDPMSASSLLTSTQNRHVIMCDLNTGQETVIPLPEKNHYKLKKGASATEVDIWRQSLVFFQWNKAHFNPYNHGLLHFTDEATVHTIDLRERLNSCSKLFDICNNVSLKKELMPCETITYCCNSKVHSELLYVATNHCLFSVDVRKPNYPLQSWKHCLSQAPVFISQGCYAEGREILYLASNVQKDVVAITSEWPISCSNPFSRYQPFLLPSTVHTLKEAHRLNHTSPSIQRRLLSCRTGMCSLPSKKQTVFTLNSVGDVFCQQLGNNQPAEDLSQLKLSLDPWCQAVKNFDLQAPIRPLNSASEWDANNLVKNVLRPDVESEPIVVDSASTEPIPSWVLTREELFESTDVLASRIMNAWGISSSADWEAQRVVALGEEIEATMSQKISRVEQWLAFSNQQEPVESQATVVPGSQQSQVFSQELVSVSQQQDVAVYDTQEAMDVGTEAAADKDVIKSKLARKYSLFARRKGRKDGF